MDFNDEFDKFQALEVYCIEKVARSKEETTKIARQIKFVMTGNHDELEILLKAAGAYQMLKKRKKKGW